MSQSKQSKHLVCLYDAPNMPFLQDTLVEEELFGPNIECVYVRHHPQKEEVLRDADVVIVYYTAPFHRDKVDMLKDCRGIVAATKGFDNVDIIAAQEKGIPVSNIPNYSSEEIADHTMMLILACARKLPFAQETIQDQKWSWQSILGASRLRGKTLGIVGLGHIGSQVAEKALAFGLNVLFFDPFIKGSPSSSYVKVETLEDLLPRCDILSLHCPLNQETCALIDEEKLALLEPGAILINTSRGKVLDQRALFKALERGHIRAAGLDVLESEPKIPEELASLPQVILTPHCAFYSQENILEMRTLSAKAALNFLTGKAELNSIVNHPFQKE